MLPLIYVFFIAYQSLVGENIWNCKRELSSSFFKGLAELSFSDLLANVLAYVPLGFLLAMPRMAQSPRRGLLWATVSGFLLSALMESLQVCLPGRVPSSLDLMANTAGAFAGGALAWVWVSILDGHIPTRIRPAERAQYLKAEALRLLAILAIVVWLAYQTEPWLFTFDVAQMRANLSWLRRLSTWPWNYYGFARHFGGWMAMLLALRISASAMPAAPYSHGSTRRWLLVCVAVLAFAIMIQIGLQGRALGPEEVSAMIAALLCSAAIGLAMRHHAHLQSPLSVLVALFAVLSLLAYQTEPAAVAEALNGSAKFHWLPQVGLHQLIHALDYALFFAWFGAMLALSACARASSLWRFQAMVGQRSDARPIYAVGWKIALEGAVLVELSELAQFWIPGRGVDSSPVIFTLLGYFFANRLVSRPAPLPAPDVR